MTYGIGGNTTGYNTHVAGTGGYCSITFESENAFEGYEYTKEISKVLMNKKIKGIKSVPNVAVVGSPTIKDGVISGFSSSDYGLTNSIVPLNITSYEIVAKFTTGALDGVQKGILANSITNRRTPQVIISKANKLISIEHPVDANTWVHPSEITIEANTVYWAKGVWDGSFVHGYYKTSADEDWIEVSEPVACTSVYWTQSIGIGIDGTTLPFDGSIDLKECYIDINGSRWWNGMKEQQENVYLAIKE